MKFSSVRIACVIASLASAMLTGCVGGPIRLPQSPTRVISLPGVRGEADSTGVVGRIDHLAYDPATNRLFVACIANGSLEVVDLKEGKRIGSVAPLKRPQGVAVAGSTGVVVVACGGDGTAHAIDAKTLEERATAQAGPNADNVRYLATANQMFVGCGEDEGAGSLEVFEPTTLKRVKSIALPSRPESFQIDPTTCVAYANLPGPKRANTEGRVYRTSLTSDRSDEYPLEALARNFPMALDRKNKRVFVACRKPAKLVVLDMYVDIFRAGLLSPNVERIRGSADCAPDSDDIFFDEQTGGVLVIGGGNRADNIGANGGDGAGAAIQVFAIDKDGKPALTQSVATPPHSRTGLFVPERRALYLAVPPQGERDAEIHEYVVKP